MGVAVAAPVRAAVARHSATAWVAAAIPGVMVAVGGWYHRWVADDAFIDFRVVANVVAGRGPVFNAGERVEAYTDPLWVAVLTVARVVAGAGALPWCAVFLGLAGTTAGVVLAARAAQRIGARTAGPAPGVVIPLGMIALCSLDAMWDFATSGLETGMTFAWLGLSWWLLVRAIERQHGAVGAAAVAGLGVLIRPDLGLVSIVFLVALMLVVRRSPAWLGHRGWVRPLAAAAALPALYQLWRMAYFALVVPNTALAKSAGSAQWGRGIAYLQDLMDPSWLWLPLAVAGVLWALHLRDLRATGAPDLAVILAAPMVGGLLDGLYVVRVGGDFMHARLLLPALFLVSMTLYAAVRGLPEVAAGVVVMAWAATVVAGYRYQPARPASIAGVGIVDERQFWVGDAGNPHPVTLSEFRDGLFARDGDAVRSLLERAPPLGSGRYLVLAQLALVQYPGPAVDGNGRLPVRVVAPEGSVGLIGVIAGPQVYLFDVESLANPIGSHLRGSGAGRAGHTKTIGLAWMAARFVPPGTALPAGLQPGAVTDARAALGCGGLRRYLGEISQPLTAGGAVSNLFHAVANTTLSFSSDPAAARRQLCGT